MSDDSHGWEFFTGFLLGTVVGAAMALLFAPQSGEETREEIRRWPKGTYTFVDHIDSDGFSDAPIPIKVAITVYVTPSDTLCVLDVRRDRHPNQR